MNEKEWVELVVFNGYGRASLGDALSDHRDINYILDILGFTKYELADDLGVSTATVSRLINGHIENWLVYRYAILKWVDLRLNDLLRVTKSPEDSDVVRYAIMSIMYHDRGYEDVCRICDEAHRFRFGYGPITAGIMARNQLKLSYNPTTFSFRYKEVTNNE